MCFLCDGGTIDELRQLVRSRIDSHGWHVAGVAPEGRRPGWAFTVGLTERFDHPELIVTGVHRFATGHRFLDELAEQVAEGATFAPGGELSLPCGCSVARFGEVHPRQWQTDLFDQWFDLYDGDPGAPAPAAVQAIPRRGGRWQDDPTNRRWRHERLDRSPCR